MRIEYIVAVTLALTASITQAGTKTWDGKYDTSKIEVTVVYFVPSDRQPLQDWRDRVDYFCRRIEQFHAREFQGQSVLQTVVHPEPLMSEANTASLRHGDANQIYYRTLQETDRRLKFAADRGDAFPILLVLSEINWRPLDDFYRLHPQNGEFVFEGNYHERQHFPGAASGGARAAYLADRGIGWGLVSADGWRVPYRGSDCVVYHEGCGHTVGLPHPEPGNGSVMSQGQYRGWISESWLDKEQKIRLGWEPGEEPQDVQTQLYSDFTALPQPKIPKPGDTVTLDLTWPENPAEPTCSIRVRYQTAVDGPWIEAPQESVGKFPLSAMLGVFDRATPVSYRIDVVFESGEAAELWGYFQVRDEPNQTVQPRSLSRDLIVDQVTTPPPIADWQDQEIDLLALIDPETAWSVGQWTLTDGKLVSPKGYGMRLELPYEPSGEYRLTAIVEPLDSPNGLLFGQVIDAHRFVTLFNYSPTKTALSAIENIDGRNVGNETTFEASVLKHNQLSEMVMLVRESGVTMTVDGHVIVDWSGKPEQLSLSDYWMTPNPKALFIGAYDCRYRLHRLTLQSLQRAQ